MEIVQPRFTVFSKRAARKLLVERVAVHLTVEYFITYGSSNSPPPSRTVTLKVRSNSLDSRAICNMNFWCVLHEEFNEQLHVFIPFVLGIIPNRSVLAFDNVICIFRAKNAASTRSIDTYRHFPLKLFVSFHTQWQTIRSLKFILMYNNCTTLMIILLY